MDDKRFESLGEELKAEMLSCKTPEELRELAEKHDQELAIDDLEGVAGGESSCSDNSGWDSDLWITC